MDKVDSISRFCKKCQCETERRASGNCKPCANAASTAWRAANPETARAATNAWRAANPDRNKAEKAAYKAANHEKVKAYAAAWAETNPEAIRINNHNRRARKRANGGTLSRGLSAKLFKLQKGKCPCCGLPLGNNYHLDHRMPLALGGSNDDGNMQLLRQRCNNQKWAKHPVDFMQERGFLL